MTLNTGMSTVQAAGSLYGILVQIVSGTSYTHTLGDSGSKGYRAVKVPVSAARA